MLILISWILTFMKKKRLNIYFKDPQKLAYVIHYVSFLIEQNLFRPRTFFSYLVRKFPSFPFHKIIAFCSGLQTDCSDYKIVFSSRFNQKYDDHHILTKSKWLKCSFAITTTNLQFNASHKEVSTSHEDTCTALLHENTNIQKMRLNKIILKACRTFF